MVNFFFKNKNYSQKPKTQFSKSNTITRIPICLVLDISGSMWGTGINELNKGIKLFYNYLKNDKYAKYSAEVAVITFGGTVRMLSHFKLVSNQSTPVLKADGGTPMGAAINKALHIIEQKTQEYTTRNTKYHCPWIVLMTDGAATDNIASVCIKTSELVNHKKLTILPIAIGECADLKVLRKFSPKTQPVTLKGLNFNVFFDWMGRSINVISQSKPNSDVELPGINWSKK